MKQLCLNAPLLLGLACSINVYANDASELERLRKENAELKQQLQTERESKTSLADSKQASKTFAPMPVAESPRAPSWKPESLKDFSVAIGTKVWVNRWDTSSLTASTTQAGFQYLNQTFGAAVVSEIDQPVIIHSDEQVTAIPTLSLRYKNFLLGGSYYAQTSFNFDPVQSTTRLTLVNAGKVTDDVVSQQTQIYNAKREEWDINAGYAVTPNIALMTGYKSVRQIFDVQSRGVLTQNLQTGQTTDGGVQNGHYIFDLDGPLLGIALSAPMAHGFGTYFNYMHGFMTEHHSDSSGKGIHSDADYNLIEGGLAYSLNNSFLPAGMPLSSAAVYAGYRYQWIEVQSDSNRGNKDITQGFAAGVNLAF